MPRGTIMQKDLLQKNLLVRKGFSSPIWKYFGFPTNPNDPSEPANEDEIVCALCNKSLSYNKSTTVMHKHLKGRHPNVFETITNATPEKKPSKGKVGRPPRRRSAPTLEEETIFPTNLVTSKNLVPKEKGASAIWTFFGFPSDPSDPSQALYQDRIVCCLCDKELKYSRTRSTSGMRKHLLSHQNAIGWLEEKGVSMGCSQAKTGNSSDSRVHYSEALKRKTVVPKRSSSWVWNYFFFPVDPETNQPDKGFVTCALCEKKMSYHGGTSPMRTHMRLLHKAEFAEHDQWQVVEVSEDVLNLNAADPKVKHHEQQSEVEEMNVNSLTEEEIFADDLLQKKGLLHKKGTCSSAIWRFFGFLPDPDDPEEPLNVDKVVCAICGKQLMYSNSSTTIMRNHLEHKHLKVHKFVTLTPRTVGTSSSDANKQSGGGLMANRKKRLSACIANYIAKDLKPLASLEEPSFKKMLHEFDPRYVLPSREDFTTRIMPRLYEQVKHQTVVPAVKNAKHVALSIDVWGRSRVEQYMAVTAHLLTSDWELKSFMLENVEFPLPHDATHIADCLNKVAADWTISEDPSKISALVTNNAVKNSFTGKHVPCLGHTLNSTVHAGLQCTGVQEPLKNCVKLVEFLLSSPRLKISLDSSVVQAQTDVPGASQQVDISHQYESHQHLEVQRQLDVLEQLVTAAQISVEENPDISALTSIQQAEAQAVVQQDDTLNITMQDLSIPLGTTHSMLHGIIDKRDMLKTVLAASERMDLELSETDFKIVVEIEKVLTPLQTLAETFLGRSYVTVSGLMPSVYYLKAALKEKDDDLPEIIEMKQAMVQELSDVYDDPSLSVILPKATFLDARYKKLPFLTEDQKSSLHDEIAKEAMLLTDNKIDEDTSQDEPPEKKPVMAWASLLGDMFDDESIDVQETEPSGAKDEIRRYLTEPRLGLEADPLKWWQQNGPRYPLLSAVAMKYLCIPSTSVPSECVFSTAGAMVAAKRSLLDARDIQLLPFLNANLQ